MDQEDYPFLNTLVIIFSVVGLVGVVFLSWMLIKYRDDLRNPAGRIVIGLTACNAVDGVFKLIGRAGIESGVDSALCIIQGFVLQQLFLTQWLLGAVLAYYTARMVLWKKSINSFKRREGWILGACFVIPLPISFYSVFGYPDGTHRLIGNANLWCWISSDYYLNFQMYLGYGPIMFIGLLEVISFFAIVIKVTRDGPRKILSRKLPYRRYLLQRYFAYMLFFFLGWTFSILNRLVTVSTKSSVVTLLATQAISNPMLGMLHFLAFWYSWRFHPLYCSDRNMDQLDGLSAGPGLDFEPGDESDSDESFETAIDTAPNVTPIAQVIDSIDNSNPIILNTNVDTNSEIVAQQEEFKPVLDKSDSQDADSIYFDAKDRVTPPQRLVRDLSTASSRSKRIFVVPQ